MAKSLLSVAEEQACWQEYCQMLAKGAAPSLKALQSEEAWANYWEQVFSLLDQAAHSEQSADADAEAYPYK